MRRLRSALLAPTLALALLAPPGCADVSSSPGDGGADAIDAALTCGEAELDGDEDGDEIPNDVEGCVAGTDSDADGIPDWRDSDSDGDGIDDRLERGDQDELGNCADEAAAKRSWPCDTDGDGFPDYRDGDSDDDGLSDKEEDENGDGLLGCCLASCDQPRGKQGSCVLNADGCGRGQTCQGGLCTPQRTFRCSNGETDPRRKDTFDDGTPDPQRGTLICRQATEDRPEGRKPIQLQKNEAGDWHVALEEDARYTVLKIGGADEKESAAVIDETGSGWQVAGFVLSRNTTAKTVDDELIPIVGSLVADVPGGSGVLSVRSLGSTVKTHDGYNALLGVLLGVRLSAPAQPTRVRDDIVARLLGKSTLELANRPADFGDPASEFVIRLFAVRRFAFAKDPADPGKLVLDEHGHPVDSGDESAWRMVIMGAVAARDQLDALDTPAPLLFADLTNGTTLATAEDGVSDECDATTIAGWPIADIIWVVDDSGSMLDNLEDVASNAEALFAEAVSAGLDFRMGVTGTVPEPAEGEPDLQGKLCSRVPTTLDDDGGEDRFLLSDAKDIFEACIKNPPGSSMGREAGLQSARAAIARHLPRTANDRTKIRPGAVLVVIIATDELPQELKDAGLYEDGSGEPLSVPCTLSPQEQTQVDDLVAPFLRVVTGEGPEGSEETRAIVHFLGGVCGNSCDAQVGHGYLPLAQATNGITIDVCQPKLATSLQEIIHHIIGASSPAVLERVPITTSLAVAVGEQQLERSRKKGFDYVPSSNALAFFGFPFPKGARVVTSYQRWVKQAPID